MKFFLAGLMLSTSLLAGPLDKVVVISPGTTMYLYIDNGEVIGRECEAYKVIKTLSDCKNSVEKNFGKASDLKKAYAKELLLTSFKRDIDYYQNMKDKTSKEIKDMQDFKKSYGSPQLPIESDPVIDLKKYKSLVRNLKYSEDSIKNVIILENKAEEESSKILSQIEANELDITKIEDSLFLRLLRNGSLSDKITLLMRNEAFTIGNCTAQKNKDGIYTITRKGSQKISKTTIKHEHTAHKVQNQHIQDMIRALDEIGCEKGFYQAKTRSVDPTKERAVTDSSRNSGKEVSSPVSNNKAPASSSSTKK